MKIGMLAELYPHLTHQQLARALVQAELQGGADITTLLDLSLPEMQQGAAQ